MSKQAISMLALAIVILLYYVGFKLYAKKKLKAEKKNTDTGNFKPRKVGKNIRIDNPLAQEKWEALANWFLSNGARITDGENGIKIVFTGRDAMSQFDGMLYVPFDQMPVRILFIPETNGCSIRMDEDWGMQKFIGPAKRAFLEKYKQAFEMYEFEIREKVE